ncbi:protein kinase [Streptomyces sp. NPDC093600]|uniref:serine/threonine-protein kinase n=1 Tax=Streptomyces sp. NPDC093600 TaxID=3366047 RepID=UPI003819FD9F
MKVRQWSVRPDLRLTAHVVAGRYRLEDLLGRGGAADVYEGWDLRLRRPVAVKVFRPGGDSQTEERFEGEGRLLAQMQHPGLVTVYDSGCEDGRPYLVMQLIKGMTLRRRIAAAPLAPAEVTRIGAALASALAHVHAVGVVHRDVKPSNILLDGTGAPHLTDFGISRLLDTTAHTATGTLVGTAAYMAPEQVLGRGAAPAADVYSLGLVLLESLKGELEYAGAPLESALARLHRPPVIPAGLPADLVELLEAMTAQDETSRPDAHACFQALDAMPGGNSTSSAGWAGPAGDLRQAGEDENAVDDTLRSESAGGRTGTAGPLLASLPGEDSPPPVGPVSTASASRRSRRPLLATGATLAVLGATLTGSIGGLHPEGESAASPPARQATTDSTSAGTEGTSEPSPAREGHPSPSSSSSFSSTAPGSVPRSRTTSPPTAKEDPSATEQGPAAGKQENPTPAASREKPDSGRGGAAEDPVRDEPGPRPAKAKPPKKNHRD